MTAPVKSPNKIVESIKKGLNDIKLVMEEGNYKLFLKQIVVIIVIFLGYRYFNTSFQEKEMNIRGQMEAVLAQQTNEQDYLASKRKLLDLEPRFPDLSAKNDWLLLQVVSIFRDSHLTPKLGSSQAEDNTNSAYTAVGIPVSVEASYAQFGQLLANIENRPEYLRISEFTLTKGTEVLGQNSITLRINTIFPKEKIAAQMFKDVAGGKKK